MSRRLVLGGGNEAARFRHIDRHGSRVADGARAQQPAMPVIGYLNTGSRESDFANLAAFRQGLGEIGYVEGQNVTIEYRWADFQYERLAPMATDLVRTSVTASAVPARREQ